MNTYSRPRQIKATRRSLLRGMSLIETMVGMVIGILVTLIIAQVWGNFENQKQRTVSGSSAQTSGLLALTGLEQDIRSAGGGLANSPAFACTNTYSYYEAGGNVVSPIPAYASTPASGSLTMVPVTITDGGAGSDALTVKRGSDLLGGIAAASVASMPATSSVVDVSSTAGFADDDMILVVESGTGNCMLMRLTQVMPGPKKLQFNPGGPTSYNPGNTFRTDNGWPSVSTGAEVVKVGQLISRSYTVNNSNTLVLTDSTVPGTPTTSVLATDIVKIKAQYGIANVGSQDVNAWVNATALTGWNTLNPVSAKRIKAIRLVIVARSAKQEAANVTNTCTNVSGNVNNGPCAWPDSVADPAPLIDLSSDPAWRQYRYRVYQTIIPMRNVIWAGV